MCGKSGSIYYRRSFDVILLVGLTELKAQIAWVDSVTVSSPKVVSCPPQFLILVMCGSRGQKKG